MYIAFTRMFVYALFVCDETYLMKIQLIFYIILIMSDYGIYPYVCVCAVCLRDENNSLYIFEHSNYIIITGVTLHNTYTGFTHSLPHHMFSLLQNMKTLFYIVRSSVNMVMFIKLDRYIPWYSWIWLHWLLIMPRILSTKFVYFFWCSFISCFMFFVWWKVSVTYLAVRFS